MIAPLLGNGFNIVQAATVHLSIVALKAPTFGSFLWREGSLRIDVVRQFLLDHGFYLESAG